MTMIAGRENGSGYLISYLDSGSPICAIGVSPNSYEITLDVITREGEPKLKGIFYVQL